MDGEMASPHSNESVTSDSSNDHIIEVVNIIQPSPDYGMDDDNSGELYREYNGVFEGPEKTLEVRFRHTVDYVEPEEGGRIGLRRLERQDLDRLCARARLVERRHLRCIGVLIDLARRLELEIDWVGYSRKNFSFPVDQAFPHQSFHQELDYLSSHRNLCERLDGNGYTLGPVTSDHWFVFVADQTIRVNPDTDTDRVLNLMMFDVDPDVARVFYYEQYGKKEDEAKDEEAARISREMTSKSGIDALCPGSIIDARAFEPCGYSMNAILFRSYSTIHITPESGSSYASFETNQKVASYKSLINNVVRTFRPKRFVMTLMADELGLHEMRENPLTESASGSRIVVPAVGREKQMCYKRSSLASIKVEDDCCCMMGNWIITTEGSTVNELRADKLRGMSVS
ncbi:Adenosylmethionine decarboxylase [Fragilaria crotonensis]|nr:Adenosylmethionine decarboxylase [Fragilaria crotonensis]